MTTLGEASGKYFMGKNLNKDSKLWLPENEFGNQIEKLKIEKEAEEAKKLLLEAQKAKQEDLNKRIQSLEMVPMGAKVLFSPYPENPYKKIMEGNIIVDYTGDFLNPDSGEMDRQDSLVSCGKVIEVGPDCKYVKEGDDIYYDTRSAYPIPFMSLGYKSTTEPQILIVINEGLKERFKNS